MSAPTNLPALTRARMPAPASCPACGSEIAQGAPCIDLGEDSPRGSRRFHDAAPCDAAAALIAGLRAGQSARLADVPKGERETAALAIGVRSAMPNETAAERESRLTAAAEAVAEAEAAAREHAPEPEPEEGEEGEGVIIGAGQEADSADEVAAAERALRMARLRKAKRDKAEREQAARLAAEQAALAALPPASQEEADELRALLAQPYWPSEADVLARATLQLGTPLALVGDPGTGKTTAALRMLGSVTGRLPALVSCSDGATYRALIGGIGAHNGATRWEDGILAAAIRAGRPIVLDEAGSAAPTVVAALHAYLAGQGLPILETGERLTQRVPVVLTSNLLGSDVGSGALHEAPLSAAFTDRCAVVRYVYAEPKREAALALYSVLDSGKPPTVKGWAPASPLPEPKAILPLVQSVAEACAALRQARDTQGLSWAPGRRTVLLATRWLARYGTTDVAVAGFLRVGLLDRVPPAERAAVLDALQRFLPDAVEALKRQAGE